LDSTLIKAAENFQLLQLEQVGLSLPAPTHLPWSLRAHFVDWAQNPGKLVKKTPMYTILKNISFAAKSEERIGIIGHNGSGKTSLCRIISGQFPPSCGRADIRAPVTSIFNTSAGIYPDLTGRENAKLLLHYLLPHLRSQHEEILADAIEFSGLKEWIDRPFRLYSLGMKARLSLSLVTTLKSEILILDEVFDGADEEFRERMKGRISSLIGRSKLFLFVSHSREQIYSVCERTLVLNRGELVFDGDPEKAFAVYDQLKRLNN
jgi:ABC-type polysaccharide/polyol phosphate transport system ATPase subunit